MADGVRLLTVLRVARRHCRITETQEVWYSFIYLFYCIGSVLILKKKRKKILIFVLISVKRTVFDEMYLRCFKKKKKKISKTRRFYAVWKYYD